jgi:nucleotide-binding universal stress UspA family protein
MERILVASDFSTRSDRALRRATLIARRTGAALTLVHVVDADLPERLIASERDQAWSILDETAQSLRRDDGIVADALVEIDDVHSGILRATESVGGGLIVLGPHRSRLRDVFVGTTVERVVRRSRFPLLVAVHAPSAAYEHTLLALDFDGASRSAARAALDMGIFQHTDVVVMHAFDAPAQAMLRRSMDTASAIDDYQSSQRSLAVESLKGLVRDLGLPPSDRRVVAVNGTPARTILETAQSEGAHLIVLGTNQRKGFERLLIGSVTEDVIRDANRDVLIVPVDEA